MADTARTRIVRLIAPFAGLFVVTVFFALVEHDTFLSAYNAQTIAAQTVIVGLGAIGMTFVIVSGGIDLSVGSVIALSSVVTALLLKHGQGGLLAALGGLFAGALVGLTNGLLVTQMSVVPFVASLGTMGIARGLAKYLADEQKVDAPAGMLADVMAKAPTPSFLLVAKGTWVLLLFAAAFSFVLSRTVFGLHTYAVGSSEATARLCGVSVKRVKVLIYTLAGALAGLAGVMQFARLTVGDPTTAIGKELDIIAAVVIGGASLSGGVGGILGSLLGAFLMSVLANGCTLAGIANYVQEILIGAIIVMAVAFDRLRSAKTR
jgi:ribose/xylose/arabinose/galactoside ABC-type transport system permease subunit